MFEKRCTRCHPSLRVSVKPPTQSASALPPAGRRSPERSSAPRAPLLQNPAASPSPSWRTHPRCHRLETTRRAPTPLAALPPLLSTARLGHSLASSPLSRASMRATLLPLPCALPCLSPLPLLHFPEHRRQAQREPPPLS